MDEARTELLGRFKRLGAVYIMIPALVVTLLVAFGVRAMQTQSYGAMVASGLNGIAAASVGDTEALDSPAVVAEFRKNLQALVAQGSFRCITLVGADGVILATTQDGPCPLVADGQKSVGSVLSGKAAIARVSGEGDDRALLVIGGIRHRSDQAPYAAIIASRPYALVAGPLNATFWAIVATIMFGATAAYLMLRFLIYQAEREIDRQEHLVSALNNRLGASLDDLEHQSIGTLQALVAAVDAKDSYTARHSLNVADYARAIAGQMGEDDLVPLLERAGLLHDIGKIGVSEVFLSKPVSLEPPEYVAVQQHSAIGAGIIEMIPFLEMIVPLVLHHHERFDGTGYPDGASGEDIPLGARILAVADAFDAMTTARPYRPATRRADAVREIIRCSGAQFDPDVVNAFVTATDTGTLRWRGDPARRSA